jgi:type I restriction enzyme M protein
MTASQIALPNLAASEEQTSSASLPEGQICDFITNESVKDSPVERTLQAVARSLVEEYGFDHTQLHRDQDVIYEVVNEEGKARRTRRKVDVVVYPEGVSKDDPDQIIRVCLVQSPSTKANDGRRGVILLEEVMGVLPACDYGLWPMAQTWSLSRNSRVKDASNRNTQTCMTYRVTATQPLTSTVPIAR